MCIYLEFELLRERLSCITCVGQRTNFRMKVCNYIINTVFVNSLAFHSITDS